MNTLNNTLLTEGQQKWPDGLNPKDDTTKKEITDFTMYKIAEYTVYNYKDVVLWEAFTDDFRTFTADTFKTCNQGVVRNLREFLRQRGVWVQKKRGYAMYDALFATIQEDEPEPWTTFEVEQCIQKGEEFNSNRIKLLRTQPTSRATSQRPTPGPTSPRLVAQSTPLPLDIPLPPLPPSPIIRPAIPVQQHIPPSITSPEAFYRSPTIPVQTDQHQESPSYSIPARQTIQRDFNNELMSLTSLTKLYTDDNRYTGQDDSFDLKLTMFHDLCSRAGVSDETKAKAYPTMLRGQALDHYYINCRNAGGNTASFYDLCNSTRNYFEGPEYKRNCLMKWNEATLRSTIASNTGKPTLECLQLLIKELRHLQHSLDQPFQSDTFLHNKLVLACRELPACQYACYKPSETLPGLMNDLQSSIITYEKTHSTSDAFFTDRRFHRNQPRPSHSRDQPRPSNSRAAKRCFVCKKEGCWSTRHTQEERDESKRRFQQQLDRSRPQAGQRFRKHTQQYITEYEGTEEEDGWGEMSELVNALILDAEDTEDQPSEVKGLTTEEVEGLITSFSETEATETFVSLADRSFVHSLTCTIPNEIDQSDPFAYTTTTTGRYNSDRFYGVMIDTGASKRSTAGWGQYQAYQKSQGQGYDTDIDTTTAGAVNVQFGIGSTPSIGSIMINTPVGYVEFHVVKADTPFLLCLADMDALKVYYNNLRDELITPSRSIQVCRQFGHPFLLWGVHLQSYVTTSFDINPCYLTSTELRRLHRRFGHPSVERLHKVLERSGHDTDKKAIERLTKYCSFCQKHGKSPGRFKFTLRDDQDSDFNHSIFVDIMYIDGSPVLHVIDEATRFQAAKWLQNLSAKHTWDILRHCWIDVYLGPPDCIVHDAGKNFVSKEFRQHASTMAITTRSVPVEAHWSIGLVERAHPVLRRAYQIIAEELQGSGTTKEMNLQMAVKAVNDTAGPDGLVPTLLVFGAYPRMGEFDPPAPSVTQRATAIRKAMDEVAKVRAKIQVNDALNHRNGPSTEAIHSLPVNSDVLVWREGNTGHSGKWTGPFKLMSIENETCKVQLPSGLTDFRTTVVRPYFEDHVEDHVDSQTEDQVDDQGEHQEPRRNATRSRQLPARFRQNTADISILLQESSETFENAPVPTPSFKDSRQKELNGLLEKGVFEVVDMTHVPQGVRIFNSRFVDEVKHAGTDKAFEKSRLVVQAYHDYEKDLVLTQSPTIQRVSQRLVLALSAILRQEKSASLYLRDISQAYVQSETCLNRDFFVRPPRELQLKDGLILKVIKPLYGVPEAGNHWFNTYHRYHVQKLQMKESTYDPCLLYTNTNGFGVVGLQTDDTLFLADNTFAASEETNLKKAKFMAKDREVLTCDTPIKFNGGQIRLENDSIVLTQERQCQNLRLVALGRAIDLKSSRGAVRQAVTPKDQYIAQRARGAYIATVCQPEAAFDLSFAAQVVNPKEENAKQLNKRLQWQIDNPSRGLRFVQLDKSTLKLIVFTDSSFANNHDYSSQIGFVITLVDDSNKANIIHWSSIKCKRVTRSVLASELYGMAHGFDIGATIKSTVEKILQIDILPLILCTDSKSLFDCLVKLGTTQEKRLMVDLMCLRQSYERREIAEIKWIDGNSNPADAMTKSKPCQALRELIDTNTVDLKVTEWVERV